VAWHAVLKDEHPERFAELVGDIVYGRKALREIHRSYALDCSYSSLRSFSSTLPIRSKSSELNAVSDVVQSITGSRTDLTEMQKFVLDRLVDALLEPGVKATTVAGIAKAIDAFERTALMAASDEREQEKHDAWRKDYEQKLIAKLSAASRKTQAGKLSPEEIAKVILSLEAPPVSKTGAGATP